MASPLAHWLSTFKDGLLEVIYPNACYLCGAFPAQGPVCPACEHLLVTDNHAICPRCAASIGPYAVLADGCIHCREQNFAFDRAWRLGPYEGLLREAILRLKYSRDENLAEIIGDIGARHLETRLKAVAPQAVIPVPLHWIRRYWERGFNQSEMLARCLAKNLCIPVYPQCLRRIRRTPRQVVQTSAAVRHENVRGAFRARAGHDFEGKHVLLVDDVMTTGATINEAAKALRSFKPASIGVVVLGRG